MVLPDFMTTAVSIAGVEAPKECDGISILPTLIGKGKQKLHDYLFWTAKNKHAVRSSGWKAYATRLDLGELVNWELYNLKDDRGEVINVASNASLQVTVKPINIKNNGSGYIQAGVVKLDAFCNIEIEFATSVFIQV
jgi:arylsulfatase A-like enzyme